VSWGPAATPFGAARPPPAGGASGIIVPVTWPHRSLVIALALVLPACPGGGEQDPDTTSAESTDDGPPGPDTTDPDDSGGNCVAGQNGCQCLEGQCVGGTHCVEDMCVQGPIIDLGDQPNRAVVGGVLVPIQANAMADEYSWSQVSGPPVEILGAETLQIAVDVPADAPPGESATLRLSATRNGVTVAADLDIRILEADFQDALPAISDPAELGTTEGIAFDATGMWVASSEGFVSRFDSAGMFVQRYDVPGQPAGVHYRDENLFIANREGTGRVEVLNTVGGSLSTLFDVAGTGVSRFASIGNQDFYELYVSTGADGTVLRYNSQIDDTNTFLDGMGVVGPNALAFGPEGNAIYVGAQGHVWRVALTDDGVAGTVEDYLVLPDETCDVSGLVFDEGSNLWVGCPNVASLFVAHYAVTPPAEVSRSFTDVGGGVSRFVNLGFGRDEFAEDTLYYTNQVDGTVGRLRVGLRGL
jgi:sugar lactone lactonase YvrE